jgi:hypothetical protein
MAGDGAGAPAYFIDVAGKTGLDFVHFNGMSGEYYFPEMAGQGGAVLDYDNDGDLDVYVIQGSMLGPGKDLKDALVKPTQSFPGDRLFRNDLLVKADGSRELKFTDVTRESNINVQGYGMGVATGDYDNDGRVDLYVTAYGANHLLHNNGDGTFSDTTRQAGVEDNRWGTSATFFDYDRDGWLDLYVVNYVDYSVEKNPRCYAASSRRDYCGPAAFKGVNDRLFRNRGDGSFEDVTRKALPGYKPGPGLGVVTADFNTDGWQDIYVANDGKPNQLWLNLGNGRFRDEGLFSGTAVNREGRAEASMGVDAGDFDADGDEDLFMTHLMGETNTLYVNDGNALFADRTREFGLGASSFPYTSFGTAWFDYDNDGWLDLLVLNGAVRIIETLARKEDIYPLHQTNQLFRNLGGRRFRDVTDRAGEVFALSEVSRGAAFGDIDNDGDSDVVVFNNNGRLRLLLNQGGNRRPWLGLRLLDRAGKRDMHGARVGVLRNDAPTLWRRVHTDGSYCSASDPRVLIGLGEHSKVSGLEIVWPDGSREKRSKPALGKYTTVKQTTRAGNREQ